MLIIPVERLSAAAVQGLMEEFITREGTDYGAEEVSLADKVAQVRDQLARGEVVIVFDAVLESVSIKSRRDAQQAEREYQQLDGGGEVVSPQSLSSPRKPSAGKSADDDWMFNQDTHADDDY